MARLEADRTTATALAQFAKLAEAEGEESARCGDDQGVPRTRRARHHLLGTQTLDHAARGELVLLRIVPQLSCGGKEGIVRRLWRERTAAKEGGAGSDSNRGKLSTCAKALHGPQRQGQ